MYIPQVQKRKESLAGSHLKHVAVLALSPFE